MNKSDEAYKTIGEVVKILNLKSRSGQKNPTYTIRYWEKEFKQIKPKVLSGNRRYYDKSNIDLLKKIKFLLKDQGMTINGVRKILNKSDTNDLDEISNKSIRADNLRNKILNISSKKYIFTYRKKKFINIPKVLHYPNGGFLDKHVDFNYNNDSNFIIVTSQKKFHFDKGGLSYEINKKYIDVEDFLQIGDIVCNDYEIKHGVKKIRLKKSQIGRFSLVLSMHQL